MIIGLMGFEFQSPNKGCEALSYSFLSILENLLENEENVIIYNFTLLDLGIIPEMFPKFKFYAIKQKLRDLTFKYIKALKKCDIIFDVTMGDSFSDIYSEEYYNYLIREKKLAEIFSKKYILLPQTYGPFSSDSSKNKAKKILNKATKIYCRDSLSQEILKDQLGIYNTQLFTDMAFLLPVNHTMYNFAPSKRLRVGLNISGLLYNGGFNRKNQFGLSFDYKSYIRSLLDYFSTNESRFEVHLIPHVIDIQENSYDDDYKVCKILKNNTNEIHLAPAFKTSIEAKSYISNMDIFIGSRMHSTIASYSSGVPTIPVSYSRKFEGLFDSLNYPYLINGQKFNLNEAIKKTIEFIENRNILKQSIYNNMENMKENQASFIACIAKDLQKYGR